MKAIATHWPLYVFTFTLICHCIVTQPLNYFVMWLKSLDRFSVYQINLFPTAAQATGLVFTLAYGWLSDGIRSRWKVLVIPATLNFVGMVIVASYPSYGATFLGYMLNATSWGFWPVLYAWAIEVMHKDMEERAIVIGVAQRFGQAFIAWVPVLILDVGKYAPRFKMGFYIYVHPDVPFQHAVQKLSQEADAGMLVIIYQNLRSHLALGHRAPHNVVLTKRWLMVIPRRLGRIADGEMAANSAVMVGMVWMTKEHEYELWTRGDPMKFLPDFGVPR
ncbi:hypothetical protein PMIN05_009738 [Paraphaeosphaeria minitans]